MSKFSFLHIWVIDFWLDIFFFLPTYWRFLLFCFSRRNTCHFTMFLKSSSLLLYITWNLFLSSFILSGSLSLSSYLFWGFPGLAVYQSSWNSFILDHWINSTSFYPSHFPSCFAGIHVQMTSQKGSMEGNFWVLEYLKMYFLPSLLTDSLAGYRIPGSKPFILST